MGDQTIARTLPPQENNVYDKQAPPCAQYVGGVTPCASLDSRPPGSARYFGMRMRRMNMLIAQASVS